MTKRKFVKLCVSTRLTREPFKLFLGFTSGVPIIVTTCTMRTIIYKYWLAIKLSAIKLQFVAYNL